MDQWLHTLEKWILSWSILIISFIIIGNVLSRELTGSSWQGTFEISRLALIIVTFFGISYAARKGRHITMSALFDLAPKKVKKVLAISNPIITAIILFILAYYAYDYMMWVYDMGRTTSQLQFPFWIMVLFVPIGLALGGIQFLRNAWVNIVNEEVYLAEDKKDYENQET
nr:TRAP transporter small permease [Texcoconibacillus texcoconensis]